MADKPRVPSNFYTVFTLIALIALLGGLIFVIMRSNELFGTWNPMEVKDIGGMLWHRMLPLPG